MIHIDTTTMAQRSSCPTSPVSWLMGFVFMSSILTALANNHLAFKVECDFGESIYTNKFSASITGTLAAKFGNARQCRITHRMSSGIVRVFLNTINTTNNSRLYVVVMKKMEVLFLGNADSSYLTNGSSYHFHTCPQESAKEETQLQLIMLGIPENGTFQAQVYLDQSSLRASDISNGVKNVQVREDGLSTVLVLDIEEFYLFELHQITATSEDVEMVCTLIISQDCQEVQRQGLSGPSSDIKSIRLSFTTFGRITLSQYSYPKIAAGRWYIGVYAKEKHVKHTKEKAVTITVKTAFKYESMAGKSLPAMYMFLATLLGGTAIAMFAHFFLNSDFEETKMFFHDAEDENFKGTQSSRMRRRGKSIQGYAPKPMSKRTVPFTGWMKVICIHWFGKGTKTYSYITGVLAISFMVGSAQFVIALWSCMIKSGNRDTCYYNEGCYRPIAISDIPSNFMLSNVPYVILGVTLALSFSFREAISREYEGRQRTPLEVPPVDRFIPYDYSLSYAFSWALVFEGLFSATYHLCPSRLTFQFDSAFMFIISGLVVVALYNSRVNRFLFTQEDTPMPKPPSETVVQAPKYFLFFVAPLLILNYVGSVKDTEGLPFSMEVMYWIALIVWLIAMYCWMLKKVAVSCTLKQCKTPEGALKWVWVTAFPICLLLIGLSKLGDWSQFFLFSCVAAVALSIAGMITLNLVLSCTRRSGGDDRHILIQCCQPRKIGTSVIKNWHRILFCLVCFLFWMLAMYFFKGKPTTRKVATPSISRTFNHECVLWDFFDFHDIWHMLSSFALFMSAYLLVYVTRKSEKIYYVESLYDRERNQLTLQHNGQEELRLQGKNTGVFTNGGSTVIKEMLVERKATYV